ncbi:MAG: hypothetical protein WCR54_01530 [Clostridia bacterium]
MQKTFESEMGNFDIKFDNQIVKYKEKIKKKTVTLTKRYKNNPVKQKLELDVMNNNWNVYIEISNIQREEKRRTLLIKYHLNDL